MTVPPSDTVGAESLRPFLTPAGALCALALDHRDAMRNAFARAGMSKFSDAAMLDVKARIADALAPAVSAMLLDGPALARCRSAGAGVFVPLEEQGHERLGDGRLTPLLDDGRERLYRSPRQRLHLRDRARPTQCDRAGAARVDGGAGYYRRASAGPARARAPADGVGLARLAQGRRVRLCIATSTLRSGSFTSRVSIE